MKLKDLLQYEDIVIQCHDIPDADAIGSGYAVLRYLQGHGKRARLVYGGRLPITKPSLLIMTQELKIPIEHVSELDACELLVTVDCQYGAGNVAPFPTRHFAIIDHHQQEIFGGFGIIRPVLGSCATLVWDLLCNEGFDFDAAHDVGTALYYGLYADTNGFAELRHPLDRDLMDISTIHSSLITKMKNSALTASELTIVSAALTRVNSIGRAGLLKADPCDPNLLGFTSDIAQQVEEYDCCVAYCMLDHGIKLSIRSTIREIMANELAAFLCKDVGSGGGGTEKAGGFIGYAAIAKAYPGMAPEDYLMMRVKAYNENYDYVYCEDPHVDFSVARLYRKLPIHVGHVVPADLFPLGTPLTIRTLEGDVDLFVGNDIFIMVGLLGEVYPIRKERYNQSYDTVEGAFDHKLEYAPTVTNRLTGEKHDLLPHVRRCVPTGEKLVYALPLARDTKVLTNWDMSKYFTGRVNDVLACTHNDPSDIYVIGKEIFEMTYEPA